MNSDPVVRSAPRRRRHGGAKQPRSVIQGAARPNRQARFTTNWYELPVACILSGRGLLMATIQSVTGPVDTANLGMTLMHEHVVTLSPGVYENWPHLLNRQAIVERSVQTLQDVQ